MNNPPQYIPGQQGGQDLKSRKWRLADGTIIRKRDFLSLRGEAEEPQAFGFFHHVNSDNDVRAKLERLVGGAERGVDIAQDPVFRRAAENLNHLVAFVEPDTAPEPIPTQMRAAYNLADYYCNTEGDVEQHVSAPIDMALGTLDITGELEEEVRELYGVDRLNMRRVLADIFYSTMKYGAAYPYEVYRGRDAAKIVLLPPKFMWVGYNVARDGWVETVNKNFQIETPYRLRPLDGSPNWTRELLNRTVRPIAYAPQNDDWNMQVPDGESWGMKLPLEFLWPVRAKAMPYERYALPPIARAFHSIGSRAVFREMRRATIEGYRHQLWTFILGEPDKPPSAAEMAALQSVLGAMAGERTGYLAWRYGLEVKVHAPNALDNLLTSETAMLFTLEIFRDLGVSAHLATGNPISMASGRSSADMDIDLSLWLRRLEFARQELLDWELLFRLRWAFRQDGEKMVKAMKRTEVRFSKSLLEIGELIKKELQPLYMTGAISLHTMLNRAGYNYDVEREFKKDELPERELNMPMPTYNQTTTGENGTQSKTAPQGRPADSVNPKKVLSTLEASWNDTVLRDRYYADVDALVDGYLNGRTSEASFVDQLKATNLYTLRAVTDQSYRATGGAFDLPAAWLDAAARFVNSFADHFGEDLEGLDSDKVRARARLYPQEGYKMAKLNGQAAAMRDLGATHWQRAHYDNDCPDCRADAQLLHAITEPFVVMHPNENCSKNELHVRYFDARGSMILECPIPGAPDPVADMVGGTSRARRRRA